MVYYREWQEFEKNIIETQRSFYIYGAGIIYKKIIYAINEYVIGVLDINAETITPLTDAKIYKTNMIEDDNSNVINILCCRNPFEDYEKKLKEVGEQYKNIKKKIHLYKLPIDQITGKGIIRWNNQELLIDNLTFLVNEGWKRDFMRLAYDEVEKYGQEYFRKLYEEPYSYKIIQNKIKLDDFDNGLITHFDGKKKTNKIKKIYQRKIWLFGDSRVSGMLLENELTIASVLQKHLNEDLEWNDTEVMNCGIPGRDIERMVYQIKTENISEKDIVFLITGFYEYEGDYITNCAVWAEYIKEASNYCKEKNIRFNYLNLPTLLEMSNLSEVEQNMKKIFNTTEFINYDLKQMKISKKIIEDICINAGVHFYDFAKEFQERSKYGQVFINLHHYGMHGSRLIADHLFQIIMVDNLLTKINETEIHQRINKINDSFEKKINEYKTVEQLQHYIEDIKKKIINMKVDTNTIGAIVMNANPYTLGHDSLVRCALNTVDFLIVFVVSEDKSYFSFKDRYKMVFDNLLEEKRCLVVPSGDFCISSITFPEYFKKEKLQDEQISTLEDLKIFAEEIAPNLNIKIRFIGKEPTDNITNQYNRDMKLYLPTKGIQVMEIERTSNDDNEIISATKVRKLYQTNQMIKIKKYVPERTYQHLQLLREREKIK